MPGSINQNTYIKALPNFRNLGVLLRILLIVSIMTVGAALAKGGSLGEVWRHLLDISAFVQPAIMLSLVVLVMLNELLRLAPYVAGVAFVMALELVLVTALHTLGRPLLGTELGALERYWLLTILVTAALLVYFDL